MHSPDGQILAFKHCAPRSRLFCLQLPPTCPLCQQSIEATDITSTSTTTTAASHQTEVKVLPSPLKSASQSSCSLAIRPSKGHFLTDYHNSCDLHICLTTSDGKVVEFDQKGVRLGPATEQWTSCLIIKMFDHLSWDICRHWDNTLEQFALMDRWNAEAYDAQQNNCFDFVLEFLRSLDIDSLKPSIESKTKFCEQYIVPRTKLLARYISLYRKVHTEQMVTLEVNS